MDKDKIKEALRHRPMGMVALSKETGIAIAKLRGIVGEMADVYEDTQGKLHLTEKVEPKVRTKNRLQDVANILIEQLERLNDEEVCDTTESLNAEVNKAQAMLGLSNAIVNIGRAQMEAYKLTQELPRLLETE